MEIFRVDLYLFFIRDVTWGYLLPYIFYQWNLLVIEVKEFFTESKAWIRKSLLKKMHISLGSIYVNLFSLKIFVSHLLLWRNFLSCKQFLIVIKQIATCDYVKDLYRATVQHYVHWAEFTL